MSNGYIETLRRSIGRDRLIEMVSVDLAKALFPQSYWHPARPIVGRNLPGPEGLARHPYDVIKAEEVDGWIARDPFIREGHKRRIATDLAWMEREFGRPLRPTHG